MDEVHSSAKSGTWWRQPDSKLYGCEKCDHYLSVLCNGAPVASMATYTIKAQYIDDWCKHLDVHYKKNERRGNGTPSGAFAFTITKSPKDPYTVGDMLTAVRKVMTQKSCPVIKYAWYYEEKGRDENGDPIHPHIHGMYETATGGRIETKHFKRAWAIWEPTKPMGAGFRGGYHRSVRSEERYSDYIKKDGGMSESFGMDEETE